MTRCVTCCILIGKWSASPPSIPARKSSAPTPALRKRINARKKDYVHFVENLIGEVQAQRAVGSPPGLSKKTVTPRAAAFALLGMINWIYQWYRPEGSLQEESLVQQYTEIFFQGAFG